MSKLRFAFRTLMKTPLVTTVAIASLALGIGANVAIFSIFNQMILRPMPVADPYELVNLAAPGPKPGSNSCNNAGNCEVVFSYAMFRDLGRDQTVFTGIPAHRVFGANLAYRGQTASSQGMLVSGSYFSVLGLNPAVGRLIGTGDDSAVGESPVVVLSFSYWRERFDASPGVMGETLVVNGQPMTIIGVAPEGFDGTTLGSRPRIFVPITMRAILSGVDTFENRRSYWAYLFARLKPGVSIEQARTGLNVLYQGIVNEVEAPLQEGMSEQTMERFRAKQVLVEPGHRGQSSTHADAEAPLILLLGVTAFVLLIACANVANLLLARAAARSGEMAVRLSIGANRPQLIGQLLTESLLLAVVGGLGGLVVARWTLDLIGSLLPAQDAAAIPFGLDGTALMFAALITLGTGILFGLFPALHSTRPDVVSTLKGQTGQPSGSRSAARFRSALATAQIALSMTLLISAGLFIRSLYNVSRVDLGMDPTNLITFGISPQLNGYAPEQSRELFARLEEELAAIPGVSGVSTAMVALIDGSSWGTSVQVQGFEDGPDIDSGSRYNEVGIDYYRTLKMPLIAGREFTAADALGAPEVAIVNERFAEKFNLGNDVVGKRMATFGDELEVEIVGLAQNAKYNDVKSEVPPLFVIPYRQDDDLGFNNFYVRTSIAPEEILSLIQPTVARLDPNLPVEDLQTMEGQVRDNVVVDRIIGVLSSSFAVLATLLAAVGLYGVLAYTVSQRTREIGLRMALGAAPGRVRGTVLRQVGRMTIVGGTIGLFIGLGLGRFAQSMLFELEGSDPAVLAGTGILLAVVAMGAGFIPAHRASRVDPMHALRYE